MKRNIVVGSFSILSGCTYSYFIHCPSNTSFYNFFGYFAFFLLIFHVVITIILAVMRFKQFWISLLSLSISYPFININFPFHPFHTVVPHKLTVLSFNVGLFNLDRFEVADTISMKDSMSIYEHMKFIHDVRPDVICFQEFYNNDFCPGESVIDKMESMGYSNYCLAPVKIAGYKGFFGVAIFSKYPIQSYGFENYNHLYQEKRLNRSMYTDLRIKDKTIRIINVHFHSMSIRINQDGLFSSWDNTKSNWSMMKEKMNLGFKMRGQQLLGIKNWFVQSPYPVILAGDFNDTPFSFNYQYLSKFLINTFEEIGNGLGSTYHHKPFIIRIDNQFHSVGLQPAFFKIFDEHKTSDHYAILAGYTW